MRDLPNSPDRILERHVPQHTRRVFDHPKQHRHGADFQVGRVLTHVRVTDDYVQSTKVLGICVRLIASIDNRPTLRGGRRHAFPNVFGPLTDREHRTPGCLQHLASASVNLAADQEWDEYLGVMRKVVVAPGEVVLVAAITVAGRVSVVLEQVDRATDSFVPQSLLGRVEQLFENALTRLVMDNNFANVVALRSCILRMRTDVEIQPGAVHQENVG